MKALCFTAFLPEQKRRLHGGEIGAVVEGGASISADESLGSVGEVFPCLSES